MADSNYPRTELTIKAFAPVITIIGVLVGVWQFQTEQRENKEHEYTLIAKHDSLEFKRRIWQEQLDTYRRLAGVAGEIASSTSDRPRFEKAIREFDGLYWGLMAFVEDADVERQMIDLRTEILDFRDGMSSEERLKTRAGMLIDAARRSLETNRSAVNQAG